MNGTICRCWVILQKETLNMGARKVRFDEVSGTLTEPFVIVNALGYPPNCPTNKSRRQCFRTIKKILVITRRGIICTNRQSNWAVVRFDSFRHEMQFRSKAPAFHTKDPIVLFHIFGRTEKEQPFVEFACMMYPIPLIV